MTFCHFQKQQAEDKTYATEILQIIQLLGKLHGFVGDEWNVIFFHFIYFSYVVKYMDIVQSNNSQMVNNV